MLSSAAFLIGSKTVVSDAATKFIKNKQSKLARKGAAAKNARLQNAVQEEVEAVKPQRLPLATISPASSGLECSNG
jgi:hypothetical protein